MTSLRAVSDLDRIPARRWSLRRVVEHLAPEGEALAGLHGRSIAIMVDAPEDIRLTTSEVEALLPAIGRRLRDAVLLGIEDPMSRLASGRPLMGSVELRFRLAGDMLLAEILDDGARRIAAGRDRDTRRLAEAGGRAGIEPRAGGGTRAWITLPLRDSVGTRQ